MVCEVLQSATSIDVGNGDPYSIKDVRIIDVLETKDAPESGHIEIRVSCPQKINSPTEARLPFCTQHGQQ